MLGGNPEEVVNESPLPCRVLFAQPTNLPLPDRMHRFASLDRSPCPFRRPKAQASRDPLLYESVILFQNVEAGGLIIHEAILTQAVAELGFSVIADIDFDRLLVALVVPNLLQPAQIGRRPRSARMFAIAS